MRQRHVAECPELGPICASRAEPPQQHDQRLISTALRLDATLGLSERWAVAASLPLRLVDSAVVYRDLSDRPLTLDYADIHHRNETLLGVGDAWLTALVVRGLGERWTLGARAGVSLPLGHTEPDPFLAALQGKVHQHVQFGTGTFDPIVGLSLARAGEYGLFAWALAQLPVYENAHGLRASRRIMGGVTGDSAWGLESWRFQAGVETIAETAERWSGSFGNAAAVASEGNRGRFDVLVAGAVEWRKGDWALRLGLKVPVYVHTVGEQLSYPALADFGAETAARLWGAE